MKSIAAQNLLEVHAAPGLSQHSGSPYTRLTFGSQNFSHNSSSKRHELIVKQVPTSTSKLIHAVYTVVTTVLTSCCWSNPEF